MPATVLAARTAAVTVSRSESAAVSWPPAVHQIRNPAPKVSPAPIVSTTATDSTGTTAEPEAVTTCTPSPPAVTRTTFGPDARLGADDVIPFLGEASDVPPWELTDAIDSGDIATSLDKLNRMTQGGERHALQILATLLSPTIAGEGAREAFQALLLSKQLNGVAPAVLSGALGFVAAEAATLWGGLFLWTRTPTWRPAFTLVDDVQVDYAWIDPDDDGAFDADKLAAIRSEHG